MALPFAEAATGQAEANESTYMQVIRILLNSATRPEQINQLPGEVKYVFIAISCQHGPLSDLLVTSGVLIDAAPTPARLSFLAKSSSWTQNVIEGCYGEATTQMRVIEVR